MRPAEIAERKEYIRRRPMQLLQASVIKLLQCTDPDEFQQLKEQFIFSIDSVEAEYRLISKELERSKSFHIQMVDPKEKIQELGEGLDEMADLWERRKALCAEIDEVNGYDLNGRIARVQQLDKDIEATKTSIANLEKELETKE